MTRRVKTSIGLSPAARPARRPKGRSALLLGTALGAGLFAGVLGGATPAAAACSPGPVVVCSGFNFALGDVVNENALLGTVAVANVGFIGSVFADGIDVNVGLGNALAGNFGIIAAGDNGIETAAFAGIAAGGNWGIIVAGNDGINARTVFGNSIAYNRGVIFAGGDGLDASSVFGNASAVNNGFIFAGDDGIDVNGQNAFAANNWVIVAGQDGIEGTGRNVYAENNGWIEAGGDGIDLTGDFVTAINNGDIEAGNNGIEAEGDDVLAVNNGWIVADNDGIDVDGGILTVRNNQTILADGNGIEAEGNDILAVNNGWIEAGDSGVGGIGDIVRIRNNGVIFAGIDGLDAGGYDVLAVNNGWIFADDDGIDVTGAFATARNNNFIVAGADGIEASGGDVRAVNNGWIFAGGDGIDAYGTTVNVRNNGWIFAEDNGIEADGNQVDVRNRGFIISGDDGIEATGFDVGNQVRVDNSGLIIAGGDGIDALGDRVRVENSGLIIGTSSGIRVESTDGSTIHNSGVLASANNLAIDGYGGPVDVRNSGLMIGRVDLHNANDRVRNSGTWVAIGNSNFRGGFDRVINEETGVITLLDDANVDEHVRFRGLERFTNAGVIDMMDGGEGDRLSLQGETTFVSAETGLIGIDAFLGAPGSQADRLRIQGGVIGANGGNGIVVNDTNAGEGAYNPTGIIVVDVDSNNNGGDTDGDDFHLVGGPIDKGFFSYDLYLDQGNKNWVLASTADEDAFALPSFITAAQDIWYITAGSWLDRTTELRSIVNDAPVPVEPIVSKDPMAKPGESVTSDGRSIGIWGRAFGDYQERDETRTATLFNKSTKYSLDNEQTTYGFIAGIDGGWEGVASPDDALVVGLLAGYVNSTLDFSNANIEGEYSGATIGAYATYMRGGFFGNLLVKADLLDLDYDSFVSRSLDVNSYGAMLDVGYRHEFSDRWYIEPLASLAYVSTTIDGFDTDAAKVDFEDGESLRARVGARFGGIWITNGWKIEPSVTLSLWNEFSDDNSVVLSSGGNELAVKDQLDGVYGEVSAAVNVIDLGSGFSGFVKGDVRFSDDSWGGTGKAGISYQW